MKVKQSLNPDTALSVTKQDNIRVLGGFNQLTEMNLIDMRRCELIVYCAGFCQAIVFQHFMTNSDMNRYNAN